ncbi:MAG: class I SAM-dependent methyltransferase [Gemmatimonadaceae bacterium]|nr:class I SAM-dependent methyltransferase [Gemmatimonadaceae bacterium]
MTTSTTPSRPDRIHGIRYDYDARAKEYLTTCNLCGAAIWTVLTHVDRYGYRASTTACSACSLVVLNPRMTSASYDEFYRHVYRPLVSAYHGRLIDATTVQAEQHLYAMDMADMLAPFMARVRGGRFLDVGGSTGIVAALLRSRFDLKATVLDPAPAEIAEADALDIETITGLAEEWEPAGRRFEFVGMFQTIDHLLDVSATLHKLREIIEPEGIFVVDIVDFRAAYLRQGSVEAAVKIDHPYSLTEDTMEAYLARVGFEPVHRSYSADHLHVAFVCRPCDPRPDARPAPSTVREFFREIRQVQNSMRHHPGAP